LGLEMLSPLERTGNMESIDSEAMSLLKEREQARKERDFKKADRIRDELRARDYEIRDGPEGPELIFSSTR